MCCLCSFLYLASILQSVCIRETWLLVLVGLTFHCTLNYWFNLQFNFSVTRYQFIAVTRLSVIIMNIEMLYCLRLIIHQYFILLILLVFFCSRDQQSTSNMKIDTLNFMTSLLNSHSPQVLQPHLGTIIPAVITAVDDSFYRITSEALLVLNCIVKTTKPSEWVGKSPLVRKWSEWDMVLMYRNITYIIQMYVCVCVCFVSLFFLIGWAIGNPFHFSKSFLNPFLFKFNSSNNSFIALINTDWNDPRV